MLFLFFLIEKHNKKEILKNKYLHHNANIKIIPKYTLLIGQILFFMGIGITLLMQNPDHTHIALGIFALATILQVFVIVLLSTASEQFVIANQVVFATALGIICMTNWHIGLMSLISMTIITIIFDFLYQK